tara:strand:- start:132344 stop:132901 length:558 start_codon:yes stop_codon:yes gene_type:complete
MLPDIERHASFSFRRYTAEARDDAIAEVVANAFVAYARLVELGKAGIAYPNVLARYGVAQFHDGRRVGSSLNVRDVLSPHCQRRKNVTVDRLDGQDADGSWRDAAIEDHRSTPAEVASFRIDFASWLNSLAPSKRHVAELLASGESTSQVARLASVSAARISQLRRELRDAWESYLSSGPTAAVA